MSRENCIGDASGLIWWCQVIKWFSGVEKDGEVDVQYLIEMEADAQMTLQLVIEESLGWI